MSESILARLSEVIRETFDDDSIEIDRATVAEDVSGWDSLSHTILMLAIEEAFGVELPPDTKGFPNVGALVDRIAKLMPR
jgi:acyl carrier protein